MSSFIVLSASAENFSSKQSIAQVVGYDPDSRPGGKPGMKLVLVGSKVGKRRDTTEFMATEPGLFKLRNISKKGVPESSYVVVWALDVQLVRTRIAEADANKLSRALSIDAINQLGRKVEIELQEGRIAASEQHPPDGLITVSPRTAIHLRIPAGMTPRHVVLEARERLMTRLRATPGRAELETERDQLHARLSEIERLLGAKP